MGAAVDSKKPVADPEAATRERPLAQSSSFVYVVAVIVQLVGFVSSFFIAHHIVTNQAGLSLSGFIAFNLLLASSINTLGELRLGSAFVYYIARDPSMRRYSGTYFVGRAAFVVFSGIALLAAAPFIGIVSPSGALTIPSASLFLSLAAFMFLPLLWTPSIVYGQLYVGLGDSIRGQLPTLVESAVRTPALVLVALTFPTVASGVDSHAIWGLTGSYVLGAAASAAVSMPAVWRNYAAPRWAQLRHLLVYAWPLLGSMGLTYLVTNAMPILTRFYYQVGAVALFNAANGFRVLLLALPSAVVVPLFPHLAGLHERRELGVLRDRIWRALRYTGMMVVPGAVLFVVYRVNLLLVLFGTSYIVGSPGAGGAAVPLAILALSAVPLALSQIIGTALNSIGMQRLEFYLTLVQIAVLLGGVVGFVKAGGVLGFSGLAAIAFAALLSSLAALALNAYFLHSNMTIPVRWRPVGTFLLAGVAEFLVLSRLNALGNLNAFFLVNRWYELAVMSVLALAVYVAVLILVGELSRQDVRIFARSLGIGERWAQKLSRICWRETSDPEPNGNGGIPRP